MTAIRIAMTTTRTLEEARKLAQLALEQRLAACVQILPGVLSLYRWQGATEEAAEHLLLLKTSAERIDALQKAILAAHSYQTPEFVILEAQAASPGYLDWLLAETSSLPGNDLVS